VRIIVMKKKQDKQQKKTKRGRRDPKRHTLFYGRRTVVCSACGAYRAVGEECPVCGGA